MRSPPSLLATLVRCIVVTCFGETRKVKIDNLPPPLRSLGLESIGWKEIAAIATGWVGVLVYGYFVKTRLKTKLAIALLSTPAQIIYGVAGLMDSPPRTEATPIAQTAPAPKPIERTLADWPTATQADRYTTIDPILFQYLETKQVNFKEWDLERIKDLHARLNAALDREAQTNPNADQIPLKQAIRHTLVIVEPIGTQPQ